MCLSCDAILPRGDLPPLYDPNRDKEDQEARWKARRASSRRETLVASVLYAASITLTAAIPGYVFSPGVLALYFGSGLLVMLTVHYGITGQLTSSLLQGALTGILVSIFGPFWVFTFFMFPAHVILPMVAWHWLNLITEANR
jgi:hypothetical protein